MARELAIGYGINRRPSDQPKDGFRLATPKHHAIARSRNVQPVHPIQEEVIAVGCGATTVSGVPCRAYPKVGEDFCAFHKE